MTLDIISKDLHSCGKEMHVLLISYSKLRESQRDKCDFEKMKYGIELWSGKMPSLPEM